MTLTTHHIDYNEHFPLDLDYDAGTRTLRATLGLETNPNMRMIGNLNHLLQCVPLGTDTRISKHITENTVTFHPVPPTFALEFAGLPFARYTAENDNTLIVRELRPFTASGSRSLGTQHRSKAALYPVAKSFDAYEKLRVQAKATINTDFHTHSSGQISARGLIDVAIAHNASYPLHLLHDIGIYPAELGPRSKQEFSKGEGKPPEMASALKEHPLISMQERISFPPLEPQNLHPTQPCIPLSALSGDELHMLELHLSLRTDRQSSYTDAENDCYRLRYPFTKNSALLKDTIKQMARESLASGIDYVEMSFVGLDKPDTFQKVHEAIWEMERDPELKSFKLRLKHGIPRTYSQEQIKESLEKAKVLARSPYIVGVDFLGYEINKTTAFAEALEEFAIWIRQHDRDFSLCVHAGENDKNPDNVKQVIKLAVKHGVRVRIGHGLYGLDDEAIALAAPLLKNPDDPHLYIEANPDSNIALNNINDVRDIPFRRLIDSHIPFVVSSDSLGLYQTNAEQLGLSLVHAGFTSENLNTLDAHQQRLRARQHAYSARKENAIGGWGSEQSRDQYLSTLINELDKVPKAKIPTHYRAKDSDVRERLAAESVELIDNAKRLPEPLKGKAPITIIGASGSSWKRISMGHRREIAIAYDMLVHALNPEKVYFVQGRNKPEGVGDALNTAIKFANAESQTDFLNVGILTDPTLDSTTNYAHLTHMVRVNTPLDVADAIVDFTVAQGGTLIAAGGAAFTRDAILKADRRMEKHNKGVLLVMNGPEGASTEKSAIMDDSYTFAEGKELLTKLQQMHKKHPDYFLPTFRNLDEAALRRLYNDAAERVGNRYGDPDPHRQQFIEQLPLPLERER